MELEPGSTVGSYEIVSRIGAGGMGVVWKAYDPTLKRHVAIKILPGRLTADPEWRRRFQCEAEAVAALDHPNIAVIHQVGEQDGNPYIVMQFLEGQTLRQMLLEGSLSMRRWLAVGIGIADGLAHAQKNGIVHRDLKPDNVMITPDGQVKILDFGLAKVLGSAKLPALRGSGEVDEPGEDGAELTRAGKVFGSRSYMSPEQIRGETVDHRSDLFSFGVLLYEMAGGRVPFRGKTDAAIREAITGEEPVALSELADGVPAEAERVVRKALEKEPERRYQYADDLATDLRNLKRDLTSGRAIVPSGEISTSTDPHPAVDPEGPSWPAILGVAAAIVVVAIAGWWLTRPDSDAISSKPVTTSRPAATDRKMIVVLPFKNLGPVDDEYFATGITQEIIRRLATVTGLGVISSKSAVQYADTNKTSKQIGEELGVDYVLEGSVRWARSADGPSRVRITPELVRAADETAVWSEAYDEVIDDIFALESEIAEKVIDHVGVALGRQGWADGPGPTENLDAYRAYMQAVQLFHLPDYTRENFELQVVLLDGAIQLDPDFTLAHAALSRAHSGIYHFGHDRTAGRQELAKRAVDRALALAPESPDVQFALGNYYYWCHKDYDRALAAFAFVRERMPSKPEVLEFIGFIRRRQGRWDEAAANLERAVELNPVEPELLVELGSTYMFQRRYDDALEVIDRAIALLPQQTSGYFEKAYVYWLTGSVDRARATLEGIPATDDPALGWYWFRQEIYEGRFDSAQARLEASEHEMIHYFRVVCPKPLLIAQIHDLAGRPQAALESYERAREAIERELVERPDDYRLHSALGLALAGLESKPEAIRAGSKAVEIYPLSRDAVFGPQAVEFLALIYARVGEVELALDQIEQLLSIRSLVSGPLLLADPRLEPLHDHPRFRELISHFGDSN